MTAENTNFWPEGIIDMHNGREVIARQSDILRDDFFAGVSVNELVITRTLFIDELMSRLFIQFGLDKFPTLSLVAVGGYGRTDLQRVCLTRISPLVWPECGASPGFLRTPFWI